MGHGARFNAAVRFGDPKRGMMGATQGSRAGDPHVSSGGFVGFVLRSPFHGVLSRSTALVTVTGRKTGAAYTLPVQYARNGDTIWIVPGRPERKTWWRNLATRTPVTLRVRGKDVQAEAVALVGAKEPSAVEEGLREFLARFPRASKTVGVARRSDGGFDESDIKDAAKRAVIVRALLRTSG